MKLTGGMVWAFLAGCLLGAVIGGIGASCTRTPGDKVIQAERDSAAAQVEQTLAHLATLRADSAWMADSLKAIAERESLHVASADEKDRRIRQLVAKAVRTERIPGTDMARSVVDSAALAETCEERYGLRTSEARDLRAALAECGKRAEGEAARYRVTAGALNRTERALVSSDSARLVEIARPRPCKIDLLIVRPSCGTFGAVMFGAGALTGIVVSR